jgi:hypothetical protein
MSDWLRRTGTSDLKVAWTALNPTQKFWVWTPDGEVDLGDVELLAQSEDEIWQSLRAGNPSLNGRAADRLHKGQREIHWSDLRFVGVTLVPYGLPELVGLQRVRRVGRMINASCQLFSCSREEVSAEIEAEIPNEIA